MNSATTRNFVRFYTFTAFLIAGGFLCFPNFTEAFEEEIALIDSWVEDGFEFHVGFQTPPSNAKCSIYGEGLIEFEVSYITPASDEKESVYGVAIWYPASDTDEMVETYGQVIGPQALCMKRFPCRIRTVRVINTWCPSREGPLYPPGWF